jgi:hypothetical protein
MRDSFSPCTPPTWKARWRGRRFQVAAERWPANSHFYTCRPIAISDLGVGSTSRHSSHFSRSVPPSCFQCPVNQNDAGLGSQPSVEACSKYGLQPVLGRGPARVAFRLLRHPRPFPSQLLVVCLRHLRAPVCVASTSYNTRPLHPLCRPAPALLHPAPLRLP